MKRGVMRSGPAADVVKVWLYGVVSLLAGAALTPLVYNCGMALAEVTAGKQTNDAVEIVAGWCRRGGMGWYFKWSWCLAGALLGVPLVAWLGLSRERPGARRGQGLVMERGGWKTGLRGALISGGFALLLGWALVRAGAFHWLGWRVAGRAPLLWLPLVTLGWAAAHEVLFRGVTLGLFLRAMRPAAAVLLAGLFYALAAFLAPQDGMMVAEPDGWLAGWVVLVGKANDLADPWLLVGRLLPWLTFGCVLGYARWRTRSLWLPLGLHFGWALVNNFLALASVPLNEPDPIARVLVGGSLHQGLIPVTVGALVGVLLYFIAAPSARQREEPSG